MFTLVIFNYPKKKKTLLLLVKTGVQISVSLRLYIWTPFSEFIIFLLGKVDDQLIWDARVIAPPPTHFSHTLISSSHFDTLCRAHLPSSRFVTSNWTKFVPILPSEILSYSLGFSSRCSLFQTFSYNVRHEGNMWFKDNTWKDKVLT